MTTTSIPSISAASRPAMARFMPAASDRHAWETQLNLLSPALRQQLQALVHDAKSYEIKPILASHYRTYMETGDRTKFEAVLFGRRANLSYLTVGAGVLADKDCLGPLEDLIWAICEETTWATPAVTRGLPSHQPETFEMELTPAMTGLVLASITHLLEDQLDPLVRQRIGQCLLERVIEPFLDKDYWWLNPPAGRRLNNWTSVCSAGALACVTLVPELAGHRQAVIDKCFEPLTQYMETFDVQGACEEGGSYWVFGVDYLILAAELLRLDPASPDLYQHPRFKAIATFPPRIFLGNTQWITFSDCRQTPRVNPGTLAKLDERLDVPRTGDLARRCEAHLAFFAKEATLLQTLAWWPTARQDNLSPNTSHSKAAVPSPSAASDPRLKAEPCVYYSQLGWMISRADPADDNALVLSAHAGHNGLSHNHNDVGHVSVYSRTLPLITDLGVPVYDRDYFSPLRVTYFVASSLGHSVPQINDQVQLRGEQYAARVLEQSNSSVRDELVMDLKHAYGPEAGLASLTRRVILNRKSNTTSGDSTGQNIQPHVAVIDEFTFETDTPSQWRFVSAAITTAKATMIAPGQLLLENDPARGVLSFDAALVDCKLETHSQVELNEGVINCTRICLSPRQTTQTGRVAWFLQADKAQAKACFFIDK